jgi:endonuclease/exonuclease/phosphatase family metal-dependent hydrolase
VATYNAGLAVGYLPLAEERAPHVVGALARAPADLLCVQEVWLDEHWDALRAAAAPRFPHAYRLPAATPAGGGACTPAELAPVLACARGRCGRGSAATAACVARHCAHLARAASPACVTCLLRRPVGSAEGIAASCAAPAGGAGARPGAAPADVVAYGGSFGTGVLSREPLLDRDALVFEASLNPRAALYARVRPAGLGDLHVVCTHLTPALGSPVGGASPAAEQRAQIERLLPWVGAKAAGGGAVVLAGDLNAGPRAGDAIEPALPEHYARFLAAGFRDPYATSPGARCTFCRSNPLNGGAGAGGALLDHVLLRGPVAAASAEPLLREPLVLGTEGRTERTAYSDHYGLVVAIGPRPGGGG